MTERIEILIAKYFSDALTASETQELIQWIESGRNKSIFDQYIALNFSIEELKGAQEDNTQLWQYIAAHLKTPVRTLHYWKYAAAAVAVVFLGISTFLYLNKETSLTSTPPVVVESTPVGTVGKDRAVLTLDDGTNIALNKGQAYVNDKVKSDGERLVYNQTKSKAIAYNYLTVPRSGQFFIELSDQTKVWLNSESQLKYPEEFVSGQDRTVELVYGEAYFEVSPSTNHNGAKFKVLSNNQEITVLGTQFNVKAYNDETNIYTTLVEGSVTVDNGRVDSKLKPGQQAVVSKTQSNMGVFEVNVKDQISWKNGVFSFEGKTLEEIMKVIARWYDVNIIFENSQIKETRFVGVFNKYQSLEKILDNIKSTNFIKSYVVKGKTIMIK